jgi:hypothetical protein
LSKQWQDFFLLIGLLAGYVFVIIHHLRGLRLPLPHGRRVRLLFILMVWIIAVPVTFVSLGAPKEFLRVLAAPFSTQ